VRERAEARLGERLVFAGLQHRIPSYMRALDIFVLPSHRETFGAVLVEAMMAGRPVVASRGPGPDFILDDGRFGPQFPVRDHATLAELVQRLAVDPEERKRMARTAGERARETFSHTVIVPAYEDLFQRLRNAGR
jgi:glycosyltransferase involved in cell wall biosynthesis